MHITERCKEASFDMILTSQNRDLKSDDSNVLTHIWSAVKNLLEAEQVHCVECHPVYEHLPSVFGTRNKTQFKSKLSTEYDHGLKAEEADYGQVRVLNSNLNIE